MSDAAILEFLTAEASVEFPDVLLVQGPPGPAGGAVYEYIQTVPAEVWTIAHNLGVRPSATILSTGGLLVFANVQHLSTDTLTITFLTPTAGSARLS